MSVTLLLCCGTAILFHLCTYLFYAHGCLAWMYIYVTHTWSTWGGWKKKVPNFLELELQTVVTHPSCGYWEWKPGPLEEQCPWATKYFILRSTVGNERNIFEHAGFNVYQIISFFTVWHCHYYYWIQSVNIFLGFCFICQWIFMFVLQRLREPSAYLTKSGPEPRVQYILLPFILVSHIPPTR